MSTASKTPQPHSRSTGEKQALLLRHNLYQSGAEDVLKNQKTSNAYSKNCSIYTGYAVTYRRGYDVR